MDENEKPKPRKIDEIIDLPYSELTDEEIESLIEFKSECKTRDALYSEQMQMIQDNLAEMARANQQIAEKAERQLQELTQHAIKRFEVASDGQEK